jgi:hypothetical protein
MGAPTRICTSDSPIGDSGRPTGETAEPEGTVRIATGIQAGLYQWFDKAYFGGASTSTSSSGNSTETESTGDVQRRSATGTPRDL